MTKKTKQKAKSHPTLLKKIEPRIKEIKHDKTQEELEAEELFKEEFAEEILTNESRGRAVPIIRSGMIQETPIANLENFADTLPSSTTDSDKDDKGYSTKAKYGSESYSGAKNYESSDKKDYESSSMASNRTMPDQRTEQEQPAFGFQQARTSTRENEAKESIDTFSRIDQYQTQSREKDNGPVFRHKDKKT